MPRKPRFLINSQTWGGRSFNSWVISQSSHMRQSSSTGPSRNACSSGLNRGFGIASNLFQSGLPLKSSPSHQTVPASSASCSVCEICGNALRNQCNKGSLISARRNGGTLSARGRHQEQGPHPQQRRGCRLAPGRESAEKSPDTYQPNECRSGPGGQHPEQRQPCNHPEKNSHFITP